MELSDKQRDRQHELATQACVVGAVFDENAECTGVRETCPRHNEDFKSNVDIGIPEPVQLMSPVVLTGMPNSVCRYIDELVQLGRSQKEELIRQAHQIDLMTAETGSLLLDLEEANETADGFKNQNIALKHDIGLLKSGLELSNEELQVSNGVVNGLKQDIENVKQSYNELCAHCDGIEKKLSESEKYTDAVKSAMESVVEKYLAECEAHGKLAIEFLNHLKANGKI